MEYCKHVNNQSESDINYLLLLKKEKYLERDKNCQDHHKKKDNLINFLNEFPWYLWKTSKPTLKKEMEIVLLTFSKKIYLNH